MGMGLLTDILKGKGKSLLAPVDGELIPLNQLEDETYANGLLGEGIAFHMKSGTILAPADGVVTLIMHTGHAMCIRTEQGAEIILHVGLGVPPGNGFPIEIFVEPNQVVEAGDVIMQIDLEKLIEAGAQPVLPMVIPNPEGFTITDLSEETVVTAGTPVLQVRSNVK